MLFVSYSAILAGYACYQSGYEAYRWFSTPLDVEDDWDDVRLAVTNLTAGRSDYPTRDISHAGYPGCVDDVCSWWISSVSLVPPAVGMSTSSLTAGAIAQHLRR